MGKLHKQRCYLAGAIDRVQDLGKGWRESFTPFLESLGIEVFDPLHKSISIGIEGEYTSELKNKLKSEKKYDDLSVIMKEIRSVDLRMVDISDFLIVNLDLDVHPCGTLEEIFWANRQKKPIIIHMVQGKHNAPDWLFGTIPHNDIFDNWEQIKLYLVNIDKCGKNQMNNRWRFFQYE